MKRIASIFLAASLVGCANFRPITDMQNVNHAQYEADLAQCQAYATQVDPASQAAAGAVASAILGGVLAAVLGGRYDVGRSAAASGVLGAAAGGAHGGVSQQNIIRNCMAGRGYKVLL